MTLVCLAAYPQDCRAGTLAPFKARQHMTACYGGSGGDKLYIDAVHDFSHMGLHWHLRQKVCTDQKAHQQDRKSVHGLKV